MSGDMIEMKSDGTWGTTGIKNITDGNIWVNLHNGTINLKRK